jgi:hypothetical protein
MHDDTKPVDRLCSEIQLFDLCDLDECGHKKSRYCTNEQLVKMFESIKEEDDRQILLYDENELEDDDESDFDELRDDFDIEDE